MIVSTGLFTSFLFEPAFDVVNLDQKTINPLGGWEMQVTVTSPADIGRLTTEIYLHQPRITNEVVFCRGGNDLLCKTGGNGRTRDAANFYPRRIDAT
ncbi:oxidoreductase [Salmonella enterica subsp. enterica]|uniref:Oxidoreductase n=1 Tax=Salmonella enterica I TaxID=59201 RepID=A0A379VR13_SALET|nr:oxidoreductase [Salmonella enterica subsp. enterica]